MQNDNMRFIAEVSHEIRTPMHGVIGLAELALDDPALPEETAGYIRRIKNISEGLLSIVNDILDISKIDAKGLLMEQIPFSLHSVFLECQDILELNAEAKGIGFYIVNETMLDKKVIGDPTKLRQALLNFLSNAIKFTEEGSVTLTARSAGEGKVYFEVQDTGIGMSEKQCSAVFEPYKQADESTARKFGGTGLGLPIANKIIEAMGGKIKVKSKLNVGTTLSFLLEFALSNENAVNEAKDNKRPKFKGTVLLCEDNQTNQIVAKQNLEKLGFSVIIADNGKKIIEAVKRSKNFDIILMDIQMPVMDGLEATSKLLKMDVKAPIIAMTAAAMPKDIEAYIAAGMAGTIIKPFKLKELWTCLLEHIAPVSWEAPKKKALDYAIGLEYLVGNEVLYRQLLSNFLEEQPENISQLENAIKSEDYAGAARIVHAIKAVCSTMGATKLPAQLSTLERELVDGCYKPYMLDIVKQEMDDVLESISEMGIKPIKEKYAKPSDSPLDKEKALLLIDEIKPRLDSFKILNAEQMAIVWEILSPVGQPCNLLISHIENFDFDLALEVLEEIRDLCTD